LFYTVYYLYGGPICGWVLFDPEMDKENMRTYIPLLFIVIIGDWVGTEASLLLPTTTSYCIVRVLPVQVEVEATVQLAFLL
jgi:hypothetical protein